MEPVRLECKLARRFTMEGAAKATAQLLVKVITDAAFVLAPLPVNMVLALDVSGSMDGEKLECAKEAALLVVESLSADDWLSLVVFNENAKVLVPRRKADDKNAFLSQIGRIQADDGTRIHAGMLAGYGQVGGMASSVVQRMLLITDGQTEGEDQCIKVARQAAENGIAISSFGIGDDYNEGLLKEISRLTLGSVYHLRHPQEMKGEFGKELEATKTVGLTDAGLTLQLAKGVTVDEMHRIVPNIARLDARAEDERVFSAEIGVLDKSTASCFGIRLTLPDRPAGQVRVAQVSLRYSIPALRMGGKINSCDVVTEYSRNPDLCSAVDDEVTGYFDQLYAHELVEQATIVARAGNMAAATQQLTQAKLLTQRVGNVAVTQYLEDALNELEAQGTMSAGAQKTIRLGSTHTVLVKDGGDNRGKER